MIRHANITRHSRRARLSTLSFASVAVAVFGTAWVLPARAQLNLFQGYKGPILTREDLAAGRASAKKLLESDEASVGQAESWTGPNTGNQGTVTIRRVFERAHMPCRLVASEVLYKRTQTRRNFTLTACRTTGGAWKLAD